MGLCFSDGLVAYNGSLAIGKAVQGLDIRQLNKMADGIADIVENIQTISAITEEVSAHAGETCEACEGNIALVSDVEKIVNSLNGEADNLNSIKR